MWWWALSAAALLAAAAPATANSRTCFCELRTSHFTFSPLLLEVEDPVLSGVLVTCRKARLWCPTACYTAARKRLLAGGVGGVAPLSGAAGETACQALARNVTADTAPQVHVYAVYRVSNCHDSGFHYMGRLCCWRYLIGGEPVYKFNEGCQCGPAPPCDDGSPTSPPTSSTTAVTSSSSSSSSDAPTSSTEPPTSTSPPTSTAPPPIG